MDKTKLCHLCLKKRKIHNSHILPEFMYDRTYDEKHRAISMTSVKGEKEKYIQKGLRERL